MKVSDQQGHGNDSPSNRTFSYEGQDCIIQSILRDVQNGLYIDVGCNHPILENNTYCLYKKGWKGICIDANQNFKTLYAELRPNDIFEAYALSNQPGKEKILYLNQDTRLSTCEEDMSIHYMNHPVHGSNKCEPLKVTTTNLNEIIERNNIKKIDLLCLDIEGGENNHFDIEKLNLRPSLICVEIKLLNLNALDLNPIYSLLTANNYS